MSNIILKVSLFFIQLVTNAKVLFYRNVHTSMTGNAAFPNPPVTLVAFKAKTDLVETKAAAVAGARTALLMAESALQTAVDDLDIAGRAMASYVEAASMNNVETLESSGFTRVAGRQPVGILPAPENLRALQGQTNTCLLRWNHDRGARSWVVECAPEATGPWTEIYNGTRSTCVATGLTSGVQYWFRVRAIGAAGPSDWSNPATKRAA